METNSNKPDKIDIKEWEIDSKTAKKMMDHHKQPGKDASKVIDKNDKIINEIRKRYPKAELSWVDARYKDEDDEKRYSKLRNITEKNGIRENKGQVKDHKTQILMVKDSSEGQENIYYFDAGTISPPPYD